MSLTNALPSKRRRIKEHIRYDSIQRKSPGSKGAQRPTFLPEQMSTQLLSPVVYPMVSGSALSAACCYDVFFCLEEELPGSQVPAGEGGAVPGPGFEKSWQDPQEALVSQMFMGSPGESVGVSLEQETAKMTCL